jgi:hypothetical protein
LLLRRGALRGGWDAVQRDELPLHHLSQDHWGAVRRLVQRAARGFSLRRRHADTLQLHAKALRSFCGRCGTQLTFESDDTPAEIDITTASLDDADAVPPGDHIWTRSRLAWIRLADGLPEHRKARLSGNS